MKTAPSTQTFSERISLLCLTAFVATSLPALADVYQWIGPGAGLNNWSSGLNWTDITASVSGVVPGASDDLKFFDPGAATVSNVNNVVDIGFGGTAASLQFGNTNSTHTTLIAAGQVLTLSGTNGLAVGTPGDLGAARNVTNTITGPGGALTINNASASLVLNQGTATSVTGTRANLDLSGLDTFVLNGNRIGLGTTTLPNPAGANQREAGCLLLARTNLITLANSAPLATYLSTPAQAPAIELSHNPGNNAGILSFLLLGQTNAFFIDSIAAGRTKASASSAGILQFNSAFSSSVAFFRGIGGNNSRVTWWSIGDMCTSTSSSQVSVGTNDFSGGTVDALVDTLSLGRDASGSHAASASIIGMLTFTAGILDVNTVYAGNQSLGPNTSTTGMQGYLNVKGVDALLRVNNNLVLGNTTVNSGAANKSLGVLNVVNGTVEANTISVGANSLAANTIALSNGTLVVSNTIASPAKGVANFNITNSTLQLTVTGTSPIAVVTNLNAGGATNVIYPAAIPIFASYPAQVVLIQYYGAAIGGIGYNFGFGASVLPPTAPGAYLSNNVANHSIDLVLPNDPRPVITSEPSSYSGSPGDHVTFTTVVSPFSVIPLSYQWYLGSTPLSDGPTGNGSTLSGSLTPSLSITSAQITDNGNYTLIVTNIYGAATSVPPANLTISTNCVSPTISGGPNNATVVQGNDVTFSGTVAGSPLPAVQWLRGGVPIPGATSAGYMLSNPQYPADDQAVFSLVATNDCGAVTNSATLTVIVPPTISVQPTNLVVVNGNPAAFSVTGSGVPAPGYVWFKNGAPVTGNPSALTATLTIPAATPADIGTYSVQVTNAAGSLTSSNATLTVNSATLALSSSVPADHATGMCYDTPLYLIFNQAPSLRTAGKIRIYNVTNSTTPADTIDMSQGGLQARSVGGESFVTYPVIITGNQAAIYPHAGTLTSNQTYYVTVDDGLFTDSGGAYFAGISDTNIWQFTTKPTGPINPTNLVVAQDYSGDFATVQGALDSMPANNNTATLLSVNNGFYNEVVNVRLKNNIVMRGQSRSGTIIGYANNSTINGSTHFRMAVKVNANDIAFDNLTLTNLTAQDFSQAEALMVESGAQRVIVNNCNLASYQDTVLANISTSKAYFNNSLIQGDVDFIWGGGNLFFTNCEIRWLIRAGNNAALGPNPSPGATDTSSNGFSFVNCRLTTLPGANPADVVGRTRSITNGNTALINCFVSTNIGGWASDALPANNFRNWYFDCTNDLGASVTLSNGIALAANDPNITLARSVTSWLYGWAPALAPNIIAQPTNQSVAGGQQATFSVSATGIPDPAYQWLKNGTNLPGATGAILVIQSAHAGDAGPYSVVVSNAAGSVISATAALTVGNTAPSLTPVPDQTINVGVMLQLTNVATDPDVPPQTLTFALLSGPTNATLDSASGILNWRPLVPQAGATYPVSVVVTDDGSPPLSATNNFHVTVNLLTQPLLGSPSWVSGQFSMSVAGQTGPDYALQASANLTDWQTVFRTNSPAMPFEWTDPNSAAYAEQFYRVVVGPPLP
jgi:pectin methylesterase-like acyl-CoA thioesterase